MVVILNPLGQLNMEEPLLQNRQESDYLQEDQRDQADI